jgi:hypothetical protein
VHLSSKTLGQAAQIAEQIEWLEKQLDDLLQGKELTSQSESAPKAVLSLSSAKRSMSSAPQSGKAERGTLRPAVVAILKKNEKPLKTADIYDALVTKGYQFTFKEPKKVLARIDTPSGDRKRRERPHLAHSLAVTRRERRRLVCDQVDGPKRILRGDARRARNRDYGNCPLTTGL